MLLQKDNIPPKNIPKSETWKKQTGGNILHDKENPKNSDYAKREAKVN